MGRLFFIAFALIIATGLLLFPIFLSFNAHYDVNGKKFCFSLNLYKKLKLIGGYVTAYPKGLALHVSQKKAILIQYTDLEKESKKFSFFKTIRLKRLFISAETGANYVMGVYFLSLLTQIIGVIKFGERSTVKTNVWLVNGDILRLSALLIWRINGYTILKEIVRVIKEKTQIWKNKIRKSIV